jgi:hypothetical protein
VFANYLQISSEDYTLIGMPQSVLYQTNYISQLKILPLAKHASLLSYTAIDEENICVALIPVVNCINILRL